MGLVRYYLAISVVIAHFNYVFGTEYYWPTSSYDAVGAFFALSGFLVYGSYLKSKNLRQYLQRRANRILPAYWFIILLSAIGLVTVSKLSFISYFTSPQWWKYVAANLSFLNFLEPNLPGVFEGNVTQAVNGSLWTMKIEWLLYISVPIVAWIVAKCKNRIVTVIIIIYVLSLCYRLLFTYLYQTTEKEIYNILGRQFLGQLMYFYIGVLTRFYLNAFFKYKWQIFIICLILTLLIPYLPYSQIVISPLSVSLLTIWFSMVGKWGVWAGSQDNVSYDIYLFHMPIIQLLSYLGFQNLAGNFGSLLLSLILTAGLACISWFLIGKRFMIKKH